MSERADRSSASTSFGSSKSSSASDRSSSIDSIGGYLEKQRRLRGISAQELADTTRIPLRSIERLEAGYFDSQLDGFSRGFVRTVATALGLDPHETLARTLQEPSAGQLGKGGARLAWGRIFVPLLLLAVIAAGGTLAREAFRALSGSLSDRPETIIRRDPVRELAAAQGLPVSRAGLADSAKVETQE